STGNIVLDGNNTFGTPNVLNLTAAGSAASITLNQNGGTALLGNILLGDGVTNTGTLTLTIGGRRTYSQSTTANGIRTGPAANITTNGAASVRPAGAPNNIGGLVTFDQGAAGQLGDLEIRNTAAAPTFNFGSGFPINFNNGSLRDVSFMLNNSALP